MKNSIDSSVCWAVLAPLPVAALEAIADREWKKDFPYAVDAPPWEAIAGSAGHAALVSRSPGTEGSDRHFAAILSRMAQDAKVFALWLDPDRRHVFEWVDGRQVAARTDDPLAIARDLGFAVEESPVPLPQRSVAVVEGAAPDRVRAALGGVSDEEWIGLRACPLGTIVYSPDGPLGTQAWDIAEALPEATVYLVQVTGQPGGLEVLVLRGYATLGRYRIPPLDDDTPALAEVKAETSAIGILRALGIPPDVMDSR